MSPSKAVFSVFLSDALRLAAEGRECVNQLAEQAAKKLVSPAQVSALHRILHTLKGTASLVPGAEAIVEALHGIEGRLSCRSVIESASHPDWIASARVALDQANEQLLRMKRRERFPTKKMAPRSEGLLVHTLRKEGEESLWFPLSVIGRVLSPEELGQKSALCVDGRLVPVIRLTIGDNGNFGLALQSDLGVVVVAVREVLGVRTWEEAILLGAVAGLDLLDWRESSERAA